MTEKKQGLPLLSWILAVCCLMISCISFIMRGAWSTASQLGYESIGIGITQIAVITSAYTLGSTISGFFSGLLTDLFGPKKILGGVSICVALLSFAIPFCPNYTTLLLVRFLSGFATGVFFAANMKVQVKAFPASNRAFIHGFVMTGPNLGLIISNAVFPTVILATGWEYVFYISAGMIFLIGVLFLVTFTMWSKQNPEVEFVASASGSAGNKEKMSLQEIIKAFARKNILIGSFANFMFLGASTGISTYLIMYFTNEQGMDPVAAGGIIASSSFIGLFVNSLAGILSDKLQSRKKVVIPGAALYALSIVGLISFKNVLLLTICIYLKDTSFLLATRPLNVLVAESADSKYVSTVSGVYNAFSNLGMSILPIVYGAVLSSTNSYISAMWTAFAVVAAALAAIVFTKETYCKQ